MKCYKNGEGKERLARATWISTRLLKVKNWVSVAGTVGESVDNFENNTSDRSTIAPAIRGIER